MITKRLSRERGHADYGWLSTYHTFSFGDYEDPQHKNFRRLRVINEDFVEPGQGFPTHAHQDMEIVTYVLEGALTHQDSMGNRSTIRPGEVQRMSAGSGVTHSEYNHSPSEKVHLLQIWILTEKKGMNPGYEQKKFSSGGKSNQLRLIVSREGEKNAVTIYQDVRLFDSRLESGKNLTYQIPPKRHVWIQMIDGKIQVNQTVLEAGDGAAVSDEKVLAIQGVEPADFLLFDLN